MNNLTVAKLLEKAIINSAHPEQWDDDIQPSMRRRYDENILVKQIELIIEILKGQHK